MNQISSWFHTVSSQLGNTAVQAKCEENIIRQQINNPVASDAINNANGSSTEETNLSGAKIVDTDPNKNPPNSAIDSPNFFQIMNPKSYADKLVSSVGSITDKISRTKPADIKRLFDNNMPILHEFDRENRKFVEELKANEATGGSNEPVWKGCQDETLLRKQILTLSLDSRNFLSDPPADQFDFRFDYASNVAQAMAMLKEDPNLSKKRFELVPKFIAEERFWRNYFYRISLIKQSVALKNMAKPDEADQIESRDEEKIEPNDPFVHSNASVSYEAEPQNVPPEFLSDANVQPDASDPVLMAARQELGILSAEGSPSPERRDHDRAGSPNDWESDILSELNDDDFISKLAEKSVTDTEVKKDVNWEDEISELLHDDK